MVAANGLDVAFVSLTDNTPEYAATEASSGAAHVEVDVVHGHSAHVFQGVYRGRSTRYAERRSRTSRSDVTSWTGSTAGS